MSQGNQDCDLEARRTICNPGPFVPRVCLLIVSLLSSSVDSEMKRYFLNLLDFPSATIGDKVVFGRKGAGNDKKISRSK